MRVEIDTMRDTFTQLLQRQSHHSESSSNNEHQQADIVPPDITEINKINQTNITTGGLKTTPTTMTPSKTKKQKITAEKNTKTNPWMQFLESPPTKLFLNHDYVKLYGTEQKKGTQAHFNNSKQTIDNSDTNKFCNCPL